MLIPIEFIATVLIADFVSGLFHWLEDAYGREEWPITGRLVTRPNLIHHRDPRFFTRHTWFYSARLLLCLGSLLLVATATLGWLTWQVWLFVLLGVNANEVHKWAHRSPAENGPLIASLQRFRLVQTPSHHAGHHTMPKTSHYCVLTDFLNPILDRVHFWRRLERIVERALRVQPRPDPSVLPFPK